MVKKTEADLIKERISIAEAEGYRQKLKIGMKVEWIYPNERNQLDLNKIGTIYDLLGDMVYTTPDLGFSRGTSWWAVRPCQCLKSKEIA